MPLIVVGSIALDTVSTPQKTVEKVLGGSATYFSFSASFFARVRLVGVVGKDFPQAYRDLFSKRDIDLRGLETREGKTFAWTGKYEGSMNSAETMEVHLNLLNDFFPTLPEAFRDSNYVFLANGDPNTQLHVLKQLPQCKFSVLDTMNLWIETKIDELRAVLKTVDCLIINDGELKQLMRSSNLVHAGREALHLGPKYIVIKKGEHGSTLIGPNKQIFTLPSFPVEHVVDPTGAGDTFAGGMMGYLSTQNNLDFLTMKRALLYATVMASFNVEDFSLNRLISINRNEIEGRYQQFREILSC
ncbi:MAG: PfkB family carbohydrate kinase [Planctomycetota bacterium]